MFDTHFSYLDFFFLVFVCFIVFYIKKLLLRSKLSLYNPDLHVEQVVPFLKEQGGNHVSHLIFLQDKQIYWAQQKKILITYKRVGNKLIVLGDPIGEKSLIEDAIKEFDEFSMAKGLKPIYYQISARYMQHYHEAGYRFLKVGEEGTVNLENFSLSGKQRAKLRTRVNKFTRNSYTFKVIHPPYSTQWLSELKLISDSWLGTQKEKGFSVVSFSEDYVSSFPIATLLDPNGKIIAFATLATDYNGTINIDLMRKHQNSPHGTMDVLFIHIFQWAKDKGYKTCSLGMAPLSNVGNYKNSFISEKVLRMAYQHGNFLYKFKGLKEFKGKFACQWEPKYLVYKKSLLPIVLIQLTLLINTQPKLNLKTVRKIKYLFKAG